MPHESQIPDADELVKLYGPGVLRLASTGGSEDTSAPPEDLAAEERAYARLRQVATDLAEIDDDLGRDERRKAVLAAWSSFLRDVDRDALARVLRKRPTDLEAALTNAEEGGVASERVKRLRSALDKALADMDEAARKARSPVRLAGEEDGPSIGQILGRPELANLYAPAGWTVDRGGVHVLYETQDGETRTKRVMYEPMVVTRRYRDLDSGEEMIEAGWRRDNAWRTQVIPRVEAADQRAIMRLAAHGAPVSSSNNRPVVEFLAAFEHANIRALPLGFASQRMGWLGKGGRYFLAGLNLLHAEEGDAHSVRFIGEEGVEQLARAVRPSGTPEGWLSVLRLVSKYPSAYLAVYVALAAPLLRVVDCPNFIVDWSGQSGRGKSTTVRLVASVWGLPDEADGFIRSWSSTLTGIERTATALNYLPTILDESNRVPEGDQKNISNLLFMLANGSGKMRGAKAGMGMQRTSQWRTVAASTGETRITAYSNKDEGTRARVICITGAPLGEGNALLAERLRRELLEHHGHMGPRFVRWLIANQDAWPDLRAWYREAVEQWGKKTENDMARRAAQYVALLDMAAYLLHEKLGVPRPEIDPVAFAWKAVQDAAEEADQGAAALLTAWEWASSTPAAFWGRHATTGGLHPEPREPHGGWRGAWENTSTWDAIGFYPTKLKAELRAQGFEPSSVLARWKERGWLKARQKGCTYPMQVDGTRPRLVVVLRSALRKVGAVDGDDGA